MRTKDFYRLLEISYIPALIFPALIFSGCESRSVSYRIKDDFGGAYYTNRPADYLQSDYANSTPSDAGSTYDYDSIPNQNQASYSGSHIVKGGETLYSISRKYGVNPQQLASANRVPLNYMVKAGEKLQVPSNSYDSEPATNLAQSGSVADSPVSSGSVTQPAVERTYAQQKPLPVLTASSAVTYAVHTVQLGDTVTYIAEKYNVSENALCKINGLNRNSELKPGTKVKIPVN